MGLGEPVLVMTSSSRMTSRGLTACRMIHPEAPCPIRSRSRGRRVFTFLCISPSEHEPRGVAVKKSVDMRMGRRGRISAVPGLHTLVDSGGGQRRPFLSRRWAAHGHGIRMSLGGPRKAATFHLISDADTATNTDLLLVQVPCVE